MFWNNLIGVKSGTSQNRSFYQDILNGRVTITGKDLQNRPVKCVVKFDDGKIVDRSIKVGRENHRIVYGKYEKTPTETIRFKGSGKGKHGKARSIEKFYGKNGVCHSWYSNGRLVRQRYVYDNRKVAYDYRFGNKPFFIKNYDGNAIYEVQGRLDGRNNAYYGCHSVLSRPMAEWFLQSAPFEVKKNGKPFLKGEHTTGGQRIGEWYIDGKQFFYQNGVAIPKKLYETPPDKLDPVKILQMTNAQVRMALMSRIEPERIAKAGKIIHKDGDMRLYDIEGFDTKILRVKCTTTGAFYYLMVPKDSKECEPARQWTFGVGEWFDKPIKFAKET
jgi:hypothetical protein